EFVVDTLENLNLLHGAVSAVGKRFYDHTICPVRNTSVSNVMNVRNTLVLVSMFVLGIYCVQLTA
ncbi:MAG: hypothetical protein ACPHJ3_11030, partial [Rubripirellula sp.]